MDVNRGPEFVAIFCTGTAIAAIVVALRLWVRNKIVKKVGLDDRIVTASLVKSYTFRLPTKRNLYPRIMSLTYSRLGPFRRSNELSDQFRTLRSRKAHSILDRRGVPHCLETSMGRILYHPFRRSYSKDIHLLDAYTYNDERQMETVFLYSNHFIHYDNHCKSHRNSLFMQTRGTSVDPSLKGTCDVGERTVIIYTQGGKWSAESVITRSNTKSE